MSRRENRCKMATSFMAATWNILRTFSTTVVRSLMSESSSNCVRVIWLGFGFGLGCKLGLGLGLVFGLGSGPAATVRASMCV